MLKFILSLWGIFSLFKLYPFVLLLLIIDSQYFNLVYTIKFIHRDRFQFKSCL
jgi:hypothetical protein